MQKVKGTAVYGRKYIEVRPQIVQVSDERVELSNTHTASVMHIPSILSLISARINSNRKF